MVSSGVSLRPDRMLIGEVPGGGPLHLFQALHAGHSNGSRHSQDQLRKLVPDGPPLQSD
jgi:Flp pilus assembly CpaF family ATPase